MNENTSKKNEFDLKSIRQIAYAVMIWCVSIYSFNTEIINGLVEKYIPTDVATVTIMILVYAVKKYRTDYTKERI